MKIIAKTEEGFLVDVSKEELERLEDLYYGHSNGKYKVGTKIKVSEMYHQIKFMTEHKKTIDQAKDSLKKVMDNLEMIKPFVEA